MGGAESERRDVERVDECAVNGREVVKDGDVGVAGERGGHAHEGEDTGMGGEDRVRAVAVVDEALGDGGVLVRRRGLLRGGGLPGCWLFSVGGVDRGGLVALVEGAREGEMERGGDAVDWGGLVQWGADARVG